MEVLTDLILGTKEELAAVDPEDVPINVLPGLDIKGTGLIELSTLYAIATGTAFDPALDSFPPVSGEESEDGPWVFRFPDELVEALSSATPADIKRIAMEWSQTEELQQSGWPEAEVAQRLSEMSAFALKARAAAKPVHVWTSL